MKKFLYTLCLMTGIQLFAYAQTEKVEEVTIDFNTSSILNAGYPFDIPFIMKGEVPERTASIQFYYRVHPDTSNKETFGYKSWLSLPKKTYTTKSRTKPDTNYVHSDTWLNSSQKNFSIFCNGIHPNIKYDFKFLIIKNVVIDPEKKTNLNKKLISRINDFYNNYTEAGSVTQEDVKKLNTDLNRELQTALSDDPLTRPLKNKSNINTDFRVDVEGNLSEAYNYVTANVKEIFTKRNLINGNKNLLLPEFATIKTQLLAEIDKTLSAQTKLNAISKELLDVKFNPSLEEFKNYTLRDGLKILRKIALAQKNLEGIVDGQLKINNNEIINTADLHPESIFFLQSTLELLNSKVLVDETVAGAPTVLFGFLDQMSNELGKLSANVRAYSVIKAKKETVINQFPDLTLNLVTVDSRNYTAITVTDVTTSKTPYISANGGIAYSTAFQSALSYFGANFYLSPVNKKARLRDFKGWNYWSKVLCINVAIANYFGTRELNTSSILGLTSSSDLMVGIGFRPGRVIEFNASFIPYKSKPNPVAMGNNFKSDFVIGAAIDVNLISAFSSVAKVLKLQP